jgi:uncharacterized protein (TIGR03790 family)
MWRGIPTNHILAVDTRTQYYYDTHEHFYDQLVTPLRARLQTLGETNIDAILMIYGVPYRTPAGSSGSICVDNCLMSQGYISDVANVSGRRTNPYLETAPTFYSDKGHFDHDTYRFYTTNHMYLVTRLSAPNPPAGVLNQMAQMQYAEKYLSTNGYLGTVYVDSRYSVYTDEQLSNDNAVIYGWYNRYSDGDKNMAYTEHYVPGTPFDLGWENTSGSYEIGESGASIIVASNALLYSGWYNFGRYIDAFEWLPGSVGCDLNSDSASGMRSGRAWVGGAFQRGLTCAAGVIGEPYLNGHARPNVLAYYLLQGYTFGEASMLSTPYFFWQCVNLGDPLFAPMAERPGGIDTSTPVVVDGSVSATNVDLDSAEITFAIEGTLSAPEVARANIRYGTTTACTDGEQTPRGYWRQGRLNLTNLNSGTTYYYQLVLVDPFGNAATTSVASFETENAPPTANWNIARDMGFAPFTAEFDAGSSSDNDGFIDTVCWTFGDGATGVGVTVSHVYTNAGLFEAGCMVYDDDGASDQQLGLVRVEPAVGVQCLLRSGLDDYTNAMDAYITCYNTSDRDKNYGSCTYAQTFSNRRRALWYFGVEDIPVGADILSAELRLMPYQRNYGGASDYWSAYVVTQAWAEGDGCGSTSSVGVTWEDAVRGTPWAAEGGDFDPIPVAEVNYNDVTTGRVIALDITAVVSNWLDGSVENHGLLCKPRDDDCLVSCRTREYDVESERPTLAVLYEGGRHTLLAYGENGGGIMPDPRVVVDDGDDVEFTVEAHPYYRISSVMVAGQSVTLTNLQAMTVTWTNVTSNGTIEATFEASLTAQGIPQWWLASCGWTDNFDVVELEDPDLDGMPTWQEYLADTQPTNADSCLRMELIYDGAGGLDLVWVGGTGVVQYLERADRPGGPWSVVETNQPPTGRTNSWVPPGGATSGCYRVRAVR